MQVASRWRWRWAKPLKPKPPSLLSLGRLVEGEGRRRNESLNPRASSESLIPLTPPLSHRAPRVLTPTNAACSRSTPPGSYGPDEARPFYLKKENSISLVRFHLRRHGTVHHLHMPSSPRATAGSPSFHPSPPFWNLDGCHVAKSNATWQPFPPHPIFISISIKQEIKAWNVKRKITT